MKEEDFDHLVGLIYESALDPALWQETMRSLANQVEADTFHLLGWNNQKQAVTLGVNWTLNRFVKLQVNGIREHVEDSARSPVPNGAAFWSRVLRLQFVL